MRILKRLLLAAIVGVIVALALPLIRPAAERAWFLVTLARSPAPATLPHPLRATPAPRLLDTWGAARAGGRQHEGIDIFAPRGTPVGSTTRGIVTRVSTNALGGQFVGVLGPGLEWHYYAHLERFGVYREGDIVNPGDVIGYVGNTGNARGTPPHLHYAIYRNGAMNPYPRLVAYRGH